MTKFWKYTLTLLSSASIAGGVYLGYWCWLLFQAVYHNADEALGVNQHFAAALVTGINGGFALGLIIVGVSGILILWFPGEGTTGSTGPR